MAKEIMVSRNFLKGHPRAGEETFFVEKIWEALLVMGIDPPRLVKGLETHELNMLRRYHPPKQHTIRKGKRFKLGDRVVLKVWSGKPYRTPKIAISSEIKVKQVLPFSLTGTDYILNGKVLDLDALRVLAMNDGLTSDDFECWFAKDGEFDGQVICWGEVSYED